MKPEHDERRRWSVEDRLALLERVVQELTADLDLVAVLRRTLGLSVQAVDASFGVILLLDEKERVALGVNLFGGKFRQVNIDLARRMLQDGLAGWVIESRNPALITDIASDSRELFVPPVGPYNQTRSALCVPLLLPHRVVGVLGCAHPDAGYFGDDDLATLRLVADQAAVALENARLFAAEERRRELDTTLSEIARVITATLDLDEVFGLILEQLGRIIPYASASIFLLQGDQLAIRACKGIDEPDPLRPISFEVSGDHIMTRVVTSRDTLVCEDVQQEEGWENLFGFPSVHGWICAPLIARGKVIGTLTVDSREPGAYGEADARVVGAFADHAAIAVANARLWAQIERRLDEVGFLHETGQAITASLELEDVLESLMRSVRDYFSVEAASVALIDEETNELVFQVATGSAADEVVGMRLDLDDGIAGWVARSGQPTLVPAVKEDGRYYQGVDQKTGFDTQAIMAVPIQLREKTIGVIEALNPQEGRLEESDVKLLASVAILAASAIQNARHFTRARDAEQRYATLFEDSADPIIITDASGAINDVNLTLCEMLGYEKDALLNLDLVSIFEDSEATSQRLERALEGESIFCNAQIMAHDGILLPFEVRAARVFHNNQPYVQWLCHDLSERQELEQMRQDLTNMIIHDLRNPLSSVMSSLELIRATMNDDSVDIPMDQLFNVAQRSGERLYLLIDSILDMARLEDGQTDLEREQLDVQNMVAEVVEQLQPTVTSRELDLVYRVSPDLSPVLGDRDLLQRVLLNLLDNAIKFTMPNGNIGVDVDQLDEETVLFSVWDTGQGIPPEYHERIFDRFARARQDDSPGTGLGLSLCKLAVEAHGGRIWVESDPEVEPGSVFKFTLPVEPREASEL